MRLPDVYVLLHRLELEENANQTEDVEPYLFEDEDDAIEKACEIMREETAAWGWNRDEQIAEAERLADSLRSAPRGGRACELHSDHLVHLTDCDNEVFALYRRSVAQKGHLYPEVSA